MTPAMKEKGSEVFKIDESKLECSMNDLGYDEWELVVIFDTKQGDGQTRGVFIVFKRSRSS
jgi:hypothetical protein